MLRFGSARAGSPSRTRRLGLWNRNSNPGNVRPCSTRDRSDAVHLDSRSICYWDLLLGAPNRVPCSPGRFLATAVQHIDGEDIVPVRPNEGKPDHLAEFDYEAPALTG